MRKLTPGRVSYRDDFLISYGVYMMMRPCLIQTEVTFQLHRTWRGFLLTV